MKRLLSPDDVKAACLKWLDGKIEFVIDELFPNNGKQTVVREMWASQERLDPNALSMMIWDGGYRGAVPSDAREVQLVYEIEAPSKQVTIDINALKKFMTEYFDKTETHPSYNEVYIALFAGKK